MKKRKHNFKKIYINTKAHYHIIDTLEELPNVTKEDKAYAKKRLAYYNKKYNREYWLSVRPGHNWNFTF